MIEFHIKTLPDGVSPIHPDYRHLLPAEVGDVMPWKVIESGDPQWLARLMTSFRAGFNPLPLEFGGGIADPRALDYVVGGK